MIPSWIIEKQKQEREREQEKDARHQLHAPSPEPTREEIKQDSPKDNRGTTEIDFTL